MEYREKMPYLYGYEEKNVGENLATETYSPAEIPPETCKIYGVIPTPFKKPETCTYIGAGVGLIAGGLIAGYVLKYVLR